jgi:hypothetical protein
VLRLVAEGDPLLARERIILCVFSIGDRMIGVASRVVLVAPPGIEVDPRSEPAPGVDWVLPDEADLDTRPDLEIVIAPGNDAAGVRLSWSYRSPHASVGICEKPIPSRLEYAAEFARQMVMRGVEDRREAEDLAEYLYGIGEDVQKAVPVKIWAALAAVSAVSSPPTVLLGTSETYVPWELALAPEPWDAGSPPFLGAQAVVGRWTYGEQVRSPAPPPHVEASSMAVVKGEYAGSSRLKEAEQEADDLKSHYEAALVEARIRPILDCLKKGRPAAHIFHFAVHGQFGQRGTNDGILMTDKKYLSPTSIKGVRRGRTEPIDVRLVFLNACQLGQSERVLSEYGGMAAAFLGLGAGAVVAPLWKVDDTVAREVAEGFYQAVLANDGLSPAEYLRRERRSIKDKEGSPAGTRLAYLFFGHPRLRVSWSGTRGDHAGL